MSTTKTGVFNVVLSHCCQSWILPTFDNRSAVRNAFLNAGNYCELITEGCVFGTVFRRDQRYKNHSLDPCAWLFVLILCSYLFSFCALRFLLIFEKFIFLCSSANFIALSFFPPEKAYSGCACLHRKSWRKMCSKCCYWEVCILQCLVWVILISTDADHSIRKDTGVSLSLHTSERQWCHITFKIQILNIERYIFSRKYI